MLPVLCTRLAETLLVEQQTTPCPPLLMSKVEALMTMCSSEVQQVAMGQWARLASRKLSAVPPPLSPLPLRRCRRRHRFTDVTRCKSIQCSTLRQIKVVSHFAAREATTVLYKVSRSHAQKDGDITAMEQMSGSVKRDSFVQHLASRLSAPRATIVLKAQQSR